LKLFLKSAKLSTSVVGLGSLTPDFESNLEFMGCPENTPSMLVFGKESGERYLIADNSDP
jgi:hypothetical protein